jgi:hypothetical protein
MEGLIEKDTKVWTVEDIVEVKRTCLHHACRLAGQGFYFYPMQQGTTHGKTGWNVDATDDREKVRGWVDGGEQLVCVAKRGKCAILDIDDLSACEALGFEESWLEGMYRVQSPSGAGHLHTYFPYDPALDALPERAVVVVRDAEGKPIAEMKLHNATMAAPGSFRYDPQGRKAEGAYLPLAEQGAEPCRHAAKLVAWLLAHSKESKPSFQDRKLPWKFHPDFKVEELLENEGCTEKQSGWVEETFHVEVESCPHCGRVARESTLAAGVTKLLFSGTGYGFVCHACGVDTREEHERLMEEDDQSYQPWSSFIYRHDDDDLLFADGAKVGFPVIDVGQEPEAADKIDAPPVQSAVDPEGNPQTSEAPEFSDEDIRTAVHDAIYDTDENGREHVKREREIRLEATAVLYVALQSRGRGLIVDANGRFMCHNPRTGSLMDLDGREFRDCLFNWGLPESQTAAAIIEGLKNRAMVSTKPVAVYPVWHYDPRKHTLYANIENRNLCVITSEGWSLKPNGHGGVWMHNLSGGLPEVCLRHINPWEGSGLEIRDTTLCDLVRVKYEVEEGITQEDMEWLFLARLLVGCLPEMAEYRNLCAAISDRHSSGKTTLFSYPGWLFEGVDFYPTALTGKKDSDQLETVLTQKAILLADNVDRASEMAQHILCMAATTGKVSKRAHYRNFELAEARFRADVYMTALQLPKSFKGDVYSRLLIFKLAVQEQDGLTETERKRRFLGQREAMLGEIISRLQAVIRDEVALEQSGEGHAYRTEYRIKDFGLFLLRQEGLYGREEHARRLLEALTDQQRESCVEASAIEAPLDFMVGMMNYQGKRFGHSELYKEMAAVHRNHVDRDTKFYFADAKGVKTYLTPHQELLRKRWGLIWDRSGKNHYWYFKPTQQQIADARERVGHECFIEAEDV